MLMVLSLLQNALFVHPPRYAKKFYPRNINYMPAIKFFACLDFERKSSFCKRLHHIENLILYSDDEIAGNRTFS